MGQRTKSTSGSRGDSFPHTQWSRLLRDPGSRIPLETLASRYWRPVHSYIRTRWNRTAEDARDLTQDFFLWMMETRFVERADPERGRFRGFVKVALRHFLSDEARKNQRMKRGGNLKFFELPEADRVDHVQNRRDIRPEDALDDAWRKNVLARAVDLLEETLEKEDKRTHFEVFQSYFLSEAETLDYKDVAGKYGISKTDVSNYLMHAKTRYQAALKSVVAETVQNESDLQEELNWLFGKK